MARLKLSLPYEEPFDWQSLLKFFSARAIPGIEQVEGQTYRRTIVLGGSQGHFTATIGKGVIDADIEMTAQIDKKLVAEKIRRLFDLNAPAKRIKVHLNHDEILRASLKKRPGLRVPGAWDPFELGIRAILGQQVSVAAASTLAGRIATKFGKPTNAPLATLNRQFPKPSRLAKADLNGMGLTTMRAETVKVFSRAISSNSGLLDHTQSLDTFVGSICELSGLGPWTAHYMAMRLGYADAFPTSDLGIRKAFAQANDKQVSLRAEPWRPFRAYATMHLWASLSD